MRGRLARAAYPGLEVNYDARYGNYRIRLDKGDLAKHKELITDLMRQANGSDD